LTTQVFDLTEFAREAVVTDANARFTVAMVATIETSCAADIFILAVVT
jgi:hypothetical protein